MYKGSVRCILQNRRLLGEEMKDKSMMLEKDLGRRHKEEVDKDEDEKVEEKLRISTADTRKK